MGLLALLLLASCELVTPCIDPRLELWCLHEEQLEGPRDAPEGFACEPPEYLEEVAVPCRGDIEVLLTQVPGSFVQETHYFRDGEHVATRHSTDVNRYCGGFSYWYGREVTCTDLPPG